jgi:hypothetical protein
VILWDDRKLVDTPHPGLDRMSLPVATILTSELVRAGWNSLITPRQPPLVGVIVPGGNAAPGDVRSILAKADGIQIKPVVVERAPASVMIRSVMRAIDVLRDSNPVGLVVGYGGTNQDGTLDAVVDGLAAELARPCPPMYLGLGHDDYRRTVEAPAARWCRTPLAAASLFLLEAVELPRERIDLMEQARKALAAAFAEPDRMADVCSKLVAGLRSIDMRLEVARDKYLQDQ